MRLIAPSVYVKLVEVADEGVVGPRLGRVLRIQVHPLVLDGLELSEVVEVDASFAGVAAEEEDAVLKGETVGAGAGCRLAIGARRVQRTDLLPVVRDCQKSELSDTFPLYHRLRIAAFHLHGSNEKSSLVRCSRSAPPKR